MAEFLDKINLNGEQKKSFNKMKHDLESFREIILIIRSVLKWEKNFYPGIIFGVISTFFAFLWYLDLSVLTLISLFLLTVTIVDYGFPIISKTIFKPEKWTGPDERKFEIAIHELVHVKANISRYWSKICAAKEEKSTIYVVLISTVLVFLAWIGSTIDNLFCSYLYVLFVALYPGLAKIGIIAKIKKPVLDFIGNYVHALKSKTSQNDKKEE